MRPGLYICVTNGWLKDCIILVMRVTERINGFETTYYEVECLATLGNEPTYIDNLTLRPRDLEEVEL